MYKWHTGGKILKQIADLHIHSRYSMATSKDGTPEMLDLWARKKGITLLGTGDMTHPLWRQELKDKLIPAEPGLFRLKDEFVLPEAAHYPGKSPRFVLSGVLGILWCRTCRCSCMWKCMCITQSAVDQRSSKISRSGKRRSVCIWMLCR